MHSGHQFQISQLRQQSALKMVEALAVFIACLFVTALLPQLLFKYFYANAQLTEQPPIFDYIQAGTFLVGVLFFLYAVVGNLQRSMKIRKLEKEMMSSEMMGDACCAGCDGMCNCDDHAGCQCGCEEDAGETVSSSSMMSSSDSDSAVKMMKKAAGKRRSSKK